MVGMMRAEIALLIMLIVAFIFPAFSSVSQKDAFPGGLGEDQSFRLSILSSDSKRLEERMAGALANMISQSNSPGGGERGYSSSVAPSSKGSNPLHGGFSSLGQSLLNRSAANISATNTADANLSVIDFQAANASINHSLTNLSAISSQKANASISPSSSGLSAIGTSANQQAPESPPPAGGGEQGMGASSSSKFNGYYGITSSQHQMGKNKIDSSTFLSGSFSMEKAVKFQDRGI
jgi:hypothetical protein